MVDITVMILCICWSK